MIASRFHVDVADTLEATKQRLIKQFYRKASRHVDALEAKLEGVYDYLAMHADANSNAFATYGWPSGMFLPGLTLRRYRFPLPNLNGAAGQGRLMYVLDAQGGVATVIWLYNHAQYAKRPPDDEIRREINRLRAAAARDDAQ